MAIKVIVNGANGKMGRITVETIQNENDLQLVAKTTRSDDLTASIKTHDADVVVDFTLPDCIFENTKKIIQAGARPVIGTSGLTDSQITELTTLCRNKKIGGIIAPNFSIGAILMMRYAQDAAKYFPDVEIIEMHHPHKVDAPSGTARKTAELISEGRTTTNTSHAIDETLKDNTARGFHHHKVPIHAVRLTGVFAGQRVLLGNQGELLTIQHDTFDRKAMMPGVLLCVREVMKLNEMLYGMETFLL